MNVLQVSKFYPPMKGGIESAAWELTEGLNRRGVRADVLCANVGPRTRLEQSQLGYDILRIGSMATVLSTSIAPTMPWRMARCAGRYDVLHLHMPDPMAAIALRWARPRNRVVVHWHSDVIRQRHALRFYEPLQRWILGRADAIVATSEAYADASEPLKPWRRKLAIVPIGISDNSGRANADHVAAIRRRAGGRRIVFALGRMTYYKGFDVLIDAAASVDSEAVIVIGGGGALLSEHRSRVVRLGLTEKVHMLGSIDDEELAGYFEACDVFCAPSTLRSEAYGIAMLEAMSMGKPVVAADIAGSGVPWVNVDGETGFNVPVQRPELLALALNALLADEAKRRRMGAAARRRYVERFRADLMTEQMIDLYREVCRQPPVVVG